MNRLKTFSAAASLAMSIAAPAWSNTPIGPDIVVYPTVWGACTTFQFQHDTTATKYALDPSYYGGTTSPQYQEALNLLNVAIAGKRAFGGYADGSMVSGCAGYRLIYPQLSP